MRIILLGPPGAGKGTVGEFLEEKLNLPRLATGDIIRNQIAQDTEFGKSAHELISKGYLIPDENIVSLILDELIFDKYKQGVIFDGFPRTIMQAQLMEEHNIKIDFIINLEVPEDMLIKRLSSRWICKNCNAVFNSISNPPQTQGVCDKCGGELYQREDDKPEVVKKRLDVYRRKTKELVEFYQDKPQFKIVDGRGSPSEVNKLVIQTIVG